jgi:hypothetical protein
MDPHQFMLVVVAQARRLDSCALVQRGVVQEAGRPASSFSFSFCVQKENKTHKQKHTLRHVTAKRPTVSGVEECGMRACWSPGQALRPSRPSLSREM